VPIVGVAGPGIAEPGDEPSIVGHGRRTP
jgi:hypothetical protein